MFCGYICAVRKSLSIVFILIFMIQALPVSHWLYGSKGSNGAIELSGDLDGAEKNKSGKEEAKEGKENIILQSYLHYNPFDFNATRVRLITTESAIIMHHSDISTPPPDIKG